MKKFKVIKINLIPTDFVCTVILSKYVDDIINYMKENYQVNEYDLDFKTSFCDDIIHNTNGREIIIGLNEAKHEVIIHECVHAVMRWSRIIGQEYTTENHELLAYWIEYLFKEITKELKNK